MLTVNAICELAKVNPGKMLYVNVGGYLYGLSGVSTVQDDKVDYIIYSTQPARSDSRPTAEPGAGKEDRTLIGDNPTEEKIRAAVESVNPALVAAIIKAIS